MRLHREEKFPYPCDIFHNMVLHLTLEIYHLFLSPAPQEPATIRLNCRAVGARELVDIDTQLILSFDSNFEAIVLKKSVCVIVGLGSFLYPVILFTKVATIGNISFNYSTIFLSKHSSCSVSRK